MHHWAGVAVHPDPAQGKAREQAGVKGSILTTRGNQRTTCQCSLQFTKMIVWKIIYQDYWNVGNACAHHVCMLRICMSVFGDICVNGCGCTNPLPTPPHPTRVPVKSGDVEDGPGVLHVVGPQVACHQERRPIQPLDTPVGQPHAATPPPKKGHGLGRRPAGIIFNIPWTYAMEPRWDHQERSERR